MMQVKLLRKYIQCKQELFKSLSQTSNNAKNTDYERGYHAGMYHMVRMINKELNDDIEASEYIVDIISMNIRKKGIVHDG